MRSTTFFSSRMLPGQRYAISASIASARHLGRGDLVRLGVAVEVVVDEQRDVLRPLAQRRNPEPDDVQPEVQILAERARGDLRLQVAIGRGDQPHVDARVGAIGADALDLTGLEESQQHDLHARAHLADFVEEHRAVRRHFEQTGLVAIRAGETAADVTEEFGFEQRVRQTRAVEGDERRGGARASMMNQPRDDFLADACFACDQHLRIRASGAVDVSFDRPNRIAAPTRLTS